MPWLSLVDRSMQDVFSDYSGWLRHGLVACGLGSILVLAGCELGEPPIEETREPNPALIDQYKQANLDSRAPGIAANPKALGSSVLTDKDAMPEGAKDLEGGEE